MERLNEVYAGFDNGRELFCRCAKQETKVTDACVHNEEQREIQCVSSIEALLLLPWAL